MGIIILLISLYYLFFVFNLISFGTSEIPGISGINNSENITIPPLTKEDKIFSGGVAKDGIPSIDNPEFTTVEEADSWIQDNELIIAINYMGEKRVYPFQIMVWHEIVNDIIAEDPILISYCPLCGSAIAYERKIKGQAVEFGVSGKLYNSNLVMYDRLTDTYWTQIEGLGIKGELVGEKLKPIPIDTTTWGEYKTQNKDAKVLSRNTGHSRSYGTDPYGAYYEESFVWFPVEAQDDSIHAKTVIYGIEINGKYKAYKEEDIKEKIEITDSVEGIEISIKLNLDGTVTFMNLNTKEEIAKERDFWFAWYAFHPETMVYK